MPRITVIISDTTYAAVMEIAAADKRKKSPMCAVLIEAGIEALKSKEKRRKM